MIFILPLGDIKRIVHFFFFKEKKNVPTCYRSLSGRHAPGIPFIVTPAEYTCFAFSESDPCSIHTGLSLRKLCKEQGGMLMLGCSVPDF
jgi:hypothetical protein